MGKMQDKSDAQLLRQYAEAANEAAFREIVLRHTDLVYSSALRRVGSSDLARDVAQSVFTDLARKARPLADKLAQDASLVGWLYRSTRFAALNHLRDDRRRLAHERQAMEQLLSNSETAPDWDRIRPVLDEAMDNLSDEDRDALLLRYFKNHDFRAVGLALGISDDAAQKRVSRAVERLRESFAKRGVTVGAGGLVVVISANAVQAAPVGLAITISTAAALAGTTTAATATTATATKVIAMTALQKTIIGATLAAAVGTGIYEAHQASKLRDQNQTLQQQQAPLAEQIQQLQRERDDGTRLLAALRDDNERLNRNTADLLRLRGQVGSLRQQLATTEAKNSSPSSGFTKMMSDPAMKDYIQQAGVDLIKRRYGSLFQELKLTPEQVEKFIQLMGAHFQKSIQQLSVSLQTAGTPAEPTQTMADESAELGNQLASVLGEGGVARFKEYSQEIPAHTTVDLLNTQLGAKKLSDEEGARLFQLVKAEPFELTHGIAGDLDMAFLGSQADIDNHLMKVAESNQRVVGQASSFLSLEQLAALNAVLTNGINARIAQGAAFRPKH